MTEGRIVVVIVCTDKGQHPWTPLGDLSIYDGSIYANQVVVLGEIADRRKAECVWIKLLDSAPLQVNMRCPRCAPSGHIEWSYANAKERLRMLPEAETEELADLHVDPAWGPLRRLDISALPPWLR